MNIRPIFSFLSLLIFGLTLSCNTEFRKEKGNAGRLFDPANIDSSVDPRQDFFHYANGKWLSGNPIPGNKAQWGSLDILEENNINVLREIVEDAAQDKKAPAGSPARIIGDFYYSGMDTSAIEQEGLKPLSGILARIDGIHSMKTLQEEIAEEQKQGLPFLFRFLVLPDDRKVSRYIGKLYQPQLGIYDPEYYYKDGDGCTEIRAAYRLYIWKMLCLLQYDSAAATLESERIFRLEKALAQASMTRTQSRTAYTLYGKCAVRELCILCPHIDWPTLFTIMGTGIQDSIIVKQRDYFSVLSHQLDSTPLETWKSYLKFRLLDHMAPAMGKDFSGTYFEFYGRAMHGRHIQQERWKYVLQKIDQGAGPLLGKMYVDKTFRPEAKQHMEELALNIKQAFRERLYKADWMHSETRKKALQKLDAMTMKIGYPETIPDYSGLRIGRHDFIGNILVASQLNYQQMIAKLHLPVNRSEWDMTAPTVNAYYSFLFNEIVFPAGMLQYSFNVKHAENIPRYEIVFHQGNGNDDRKIILPSGVLQYPSFVENADDAVNYGSIGACIAHEIIHGFDDGGHYYDWEGNQYTWWTTADETAYQGRAQAIIKQFNGFRVLDSVPVNGALTMRENLADLGGLVIAYAAFKKTKLGQSTERIEGFTPDQRFFLSWAQLWRVKVREEEMLVRVQTEHHAPYEWRCNGILGHSPEFHRAFNVKPGDRMYVPEPQRVKIW